MRFLLGILASVLYAVGLTRIAERFDPVMKKVETGAQISVSRHPPSQNSKQK